MSPVINLWINRSGFFYFPKLLCVIENSDTFSFSALLIHKYNTYASCITYASISAFTAGAAYLSLQHWFNTLLPALHVLAVLKHL